MRKKIIKLSTLKLLILIALSFSTTSLIAGADQFAYKQRGEIFAIGDLHGDPKAFIDALVGAKILDKNGNFIAEDIDIVLGGDYANKGPNTLGVWNLINLISDKAKKKGSRVHALFGNHDTVILMGNLKKMKKKDLNHFKYFHQDPKVGIQTALISEPYKSMMQSWKAMVKIGDNVFVHGGVDNWIFNNDPTDINQMVRKYVVDQQTYISEILAGDNPTKVQVPWVLTPWEFGSKTPLPQNPFWSRETALNKTSQGELDSILNELDAKRIIAAHTPTKSNDIELSYDDKFVKIDTKNSSAFSKEDISVLRITKNGKIKPINNIKRGIGAKAYKKLKKVFGCTGGLDNILNPMVRAI